MQELRRAWAPSLPLPCLTCPDLVYPYPWDGWDIGHIVSRKDAPELMWDPSNHWPQHAACNRATSLPGGGRGSRPGRRRPRVVMHGWG